MYVTKLPSTRRFAALLIVGLLLTFAVPALGDLLYDIRGEHWVDGPDSVQPGSDRSFPDVALGPDGVAVHVWQAFTSNRHDIFVQRLDRADQPLGNPAPQLVNTFTDDDQSDPRVAVRSDGSFFVVWQSDELDADHGTNRNWVRGQLFDANATPQGSEVLISELSSGTSSDIHATVAALNNGSFVVTWHSYKGFGSDSRPCLPTPSTGCETLSVQARRISAAGAAIGAQFQINGHIDSTQSHPAVVATTDGGFVVFWESYSGDDGDSSSGSIQGRRFTASGNALSGDFLVNTTTAGKQGAPEAATDSRGRTLVVYESPGPAGSYTSVRARLFDPDLTPMNSDFLVPGLASEMDQHTPRVAGGLGYFLVAWSAFGSIGSDTDHSVNGRIVRSGGAFDSAQFQANVFEAGSQNAQAVGARGANAVISWRSSPNHAFEPDDGIIARGYEFARLFSDRFE